MNKQIVQTLLVVTIAGAAVINEGLCAQEPGATDETAQQAELVKKSLNPVASLISVPIQNNWDFGIGPDWGLRFAVIFLFPK